jgi:hypothetical protein
MPISRFSRSEAAMSIWQGMIDRQEIRLLTIGTTAVKQCIPARLDGGSFPDGR